VNTRDDSADSEDSVTGGDAWTALLGDPEINERGGEDNNDGVDFARYWAMYLLVALERAKRNDYALLFEYLQDVALLDDSQTPSSVALYQLKKRDRNDWSIASLCRQAKEGDSGAGRENGKGQMGLFGSESDAESTQLPEVAKKRARRNPAALRGQSPLGKLYLSVAKVPAHIEATGVFVSNAPFNARLADGATPSLHSTISLDVLSTTGVVDITARLQKELGLTVLSHLPKLKYEHTKLHPATMRETVRGAVGELLVNELGLPDSSGQLVARLLDAFSRLGGKKKALSSLRELIAEKGFTKEAFTRLLESASNASDFGAEIENMISDLKSEGMPPKEANKIADAARRVAIRFVRVPDDRDTLCWLDALRFARHADATADTYREMLDLTYNELSTFLAAGDKGNVPAMDLKAVALLANIHVKHESQASCAQSAEEEQ
jgi:hypothetical protein